MATTWSSWAHAAWASCRAPSRAASRSTWRLTPTRRWSSPAESRAAPGSGCGQDLTNLAHNLEILARLDDERPDRRSTGADVPVGRASAGRRHVAGRVDLDAQERQPRAGV